MACLTPVRLTKPSSEKAGTSATSEGSSCARGPSAWKHTTTGSKRDRSSPFASSTACLSDPPTRKLLANIRTLIFFINVPEELLIALKHSLERRGWPWEDLHPDTVDTMSQR